MTTAKAFTKLVFRIYLNLLHTLYFISQHILLYHYLTNVHKGTVSKLTVQMIPPNNKKKKIFLLYCTEIYFANGMKTENFGQAYNVMNW